MPVIHPKPKEGWLLSRSCAQVPPPAAEQPRCCLSPQGPQHGLTFTHMAHMDAHPAADGGDRQAGIRGDVEQVLSAPRPPCAWMRRILMSCTWRCQTGEATLPAKLESCLSSVCLYNIPISRVVTPVPVWIRLKMYTKERKAPSRALWGIRKFHWCRGCCCPWATLRNAVSTVPSTQPGAWVPGGQGLTRWLALLPGRLGQPLACGGRHHSSRRGQAARRPPRAGRVEPGRRGLHSRSDAPVSVLCRGTPVRCWGPNAPV